MGEENRQDDFVAVRYSCEKKVDLFLCGGMDVALGDEVVVDTDAGEMLGRVVGACRRMDIAESESGEEGESKKKRLKILRLAGEKDWDSQRKNAEFAKESSVFCKEKIAERNLPMKLVNVEMSLDKGKIIFYFTAENRVDFRELVKDLVHKMRMRIELRQINSRSESRIMGGIGPCGREACCVNISANLDRVSIKMAKEQGVAINPEKISGLCGRLMCCLAYEFETYTEIKATMPKIGHIVNTEEGRGKVVGHSIVVNRVSVELEDGRVVNVSLSGIDKEKSGGKRR